MARQTRSYSSKNIDPEPSSDQDEYNLSPREKSSELTRKQSGFPTALFFCHSRLLNFNRLYFCDLNQHLLTNAAFRKVQILAHIEFFCGAIRKT